MSDQTMTVNTKETKKKESNLNTEKWKETFFACLKKGNALRQH